MDDAALSEFVRYLEGEKDASTHTIQNYLIDIRQFCEKKWGADARAPFAWVEVDRYDARAYLIHFQKMDMAPTTTARKLSAMRSFYHFLVLITFYLILS